MFQTKGFTLMETMVSIGIILILSAFILPSYSRFSYTFSLLRSAHKLSQDLRRAQEMATSAKELSGGDVPPGYGIYLKKNDTYYILYADTNPAAGNEGYDGEDEVVETISLGSKVFIGEVSPASLSINFKGPDPTTTISGGADLVTIIFGLEGSSETKSVRVNKVGLIYVE